MEPPNPAGAQERVFPATPPGGEPYPEGGAGVLEEQVGIDWDPGSRLAHSGNELGEVTTESY